MEWGLPTLIMAKDVFLNKLQKGEVYLKNCLYYQQMEYDEQRGDKYDSGIPSKLFSFKDVTNGRITIPSAYIKSFFQYKPQNVKMLSETQLAFYIPDNSAKSLKKLSETTEGNALLIWDTKEFISRFVKKCDELNMKYCFSPVEYVDDSQYADCEEMLIQGINEQRDCVLNPVFIKRKSYEPQQEFRIAVVFPEKMSQYEPAHSFSCDEINRLKNDSVTIQIEPICDISTITNLQEIIDEPYILSCSKDD